MNQTGSHFCWAFSASTVALIQCGSTSSVHMSMNISMCILERASASRLAVPGRYFIVKWKSASSATQRCPVAFSLAFVKTGLCRP